MSVENQIDQERTRREILGRSDRIPPLPDVVVQVIGLLNAPDTQPEDLGKHLANDHVLVANLLAMVNSPYFGLNREITNVNSVIQAISEFKVFVT